MLMRDRGDEGASLLIALLFVGAIGLWVTAIVQLAFPNLVTTSVVRTNRGLDYDADAAMAQDIATIRYENRGTPASPKLSGVPGDCPPLSYPATSPTVTVLCTAPKPIPGPYQRYVQLRVCKGGSVSTCTSPLATADVYYFDDGNWGRAAYVSNWSTR